ncbi:MAG TPA: COX15/CtaA family protein [Myxococcota bacterium]|nr:COX15/CtaA family protein [Myxococcota bacterium]
MRAGSPPVPTAPDTSGAPDERRARRLARGFTVLLGLTFAQIVIGALVRVHDAGLACPDWPRCFGVWLPQFDFEVAWEVGHRYYASGLAALFVALAVATWRSAGLGPGVRRLLGAAAALLAAQVVLGGLTVLLQLHVSTVTAHLLFGNAFAAVLLWIVLALREAAAPRLRPALPTGLRRAVWAVAALVVLQVGLGGLVASSYAGMACPEWPTCNGGVWFPSWEGAVGLHLAHRTNAYLLILALGAVAGSAGRHAGLARPLRLAFGLALLQAGIGVANVKLGLPVEITGLHSAVSAAIVLAMAAAAREAWLRPVGGEAIRPCVLVVGAGFGGLEVARALRDTPIDVGIVDRENYHAFLPLLYQVATSGLSAQDVTHPVRSIVRRWPNVRFRMGEVTAVDLAGRAITLGDGTRLPYDALVIAAGSHTEYFGNESAAALGFPLHHVEDAMALRNHVLLCLERAAESEDAAEREALLGFVVVGGGPTGVELAGMLAEMRRHVVPRDFPGLESAMRVLLIEGRDRLLGAFPEPLTRRALEQVQELGVEVRLGALVEEVDGDGVRLRGGERLRARTVAWAAGIRGAALGERLGVPLARGARVPVLPTLQLPGHPDVYAIGDLALVQGDEDLPQVAQVAMQQGRCAAENIVRARVGRAPRRFAYRDPGAMATIGRNRAVARVFGLRLAGRLAWWMWLVAHIVFLAGFRNRVVVFVNWVYSYFTYDLGLRSIVGPRRPGAETRRDESRAVDAA